MVKIKIHVRLLTIVIFSHTQLAVFCANLPTAGNHKEDEHHRTNSLSMQYKLDNFKSNAKSLEEVQSGKGSPIIRNVEARLRAPRIIESAVLSQSKGIENVEKLHEKMAAKLWSSWQIAAHNQNPLEILNAEAMFVDNDDNWGQNIRSITNTRSMSTAKMRSLLRALKRHGKEGNSAGTNDARLSENKRNRSTKTLSRQQHDQTPTGEKSDTDFTNKSINSVSPKNKEAPTPQNDQSQIADKKEKKTTSTSTKTNSIETEDTQPLAEEQDGLPQPKMKNLDIPTNARTEFNSDKRGGTEASKQQNDSLVTSEGLTRTTTVQTKFNSAEIEDRQELKKQNDPLQIKMENHDIPTNARTEFNSDKTKGTEVSKEQANLLPIKEGLNTIPTAPSKSNSIETENKQQLKKQNDSPQVGEKSHETLTDVRADCNADEEDAKIPKQQDNESLQTDEKRERTPSMFNPVQGKTAEQPDYQDDLPQSQGEKSQLLTTPANEFTQFNSDKRESDMSSKQQNDEPVTEKDDRIMNTPEITEASPIQADEAEFSELLDWLPPADDSNDSAQTTGPSEITKVSKHHSNPLQMEGKNDNAALADDLMKSNSEETKNEVDENIADEKVAEEQPRRENEAENEETIEIREKERVESVRKLNMLKNRLKMLVGRMERNIFE